MVYLWVRSGLDWEDESAFLAQVTSEFEPSLAVWSATFEMPYHVFRHRVRQIARANLTQVRGATHAEWDAIPEGGLVMPTDDDDWFAPHAVEALERERRPESDTYVWRASFVQSPTGFRHRLYLTRRRVLPFTRPRSTCSTNNYSMLKRADNRLLFQDHMEATRWVDAREGASTSMLGERLSVVNRTVASQTQLRSPRRVVSRSELRRKYRRYCRLYEGLRTPHTPWAEPYVAMMGELMEELRLVRPG